jgi:hypothetical protein
MPSQIIRFHNDVESRLMSVRFVKVEFGYWLSEQAASRRGNAAAIAVKR